MATRRKDPKGRVLKDGEGYRSNGQYFYRYLDQSGKRKTIYASSLKELRVKKEELQENLEEKIEFESTITLKELIRLYLTTRANLRRTTAETYEQRFRAIRNDNIMDICINELKSVDIKKWVIKKNKDKASSTVTKYMNTLISPALDMAVEDELISRNPISFKLKDILKNDKEDVRGLTEDEEECLLKYMRSSGRYKKYVPLFVLELNTGLRKGELCALTEDDFDFENHSLTVNKQFQTYADNTSDIIVPKTKSGIRKIPLCKEAEEAAKTLIAESKKFDCPNIGGYSNFIILNKNGNILNGNSLYKRYMSVAKYCDRACGTSLEDETTFHSLRHTFATKLVNRGMNPKSVQYIMGHSKITTTLQIYAHATNQSAFNDYFRANPE